MLHYIIFNDCAISLTFNCTFIIAAAVCANNIETITVLVINCILVYIIIVVGTLRDAMRIIIYSIRYHCTQCRRRNDDCIKILNNFHYTYTQYDNDKRVTGCIRNAW